MELLARGAKSGGGRGGTAAVTGAGAVVVAALAAAVLGDAPTQREAWATPRLSGVHGSGCGVKSGTRGAY